MRRLLWSLALALAAGTSVAQETTRVPVPAYVVIDIERLYAESAYARSLQQDIDAQVLALAAENDKIVADLTTEEKNLTERRDTMAPEAFRAEADAFDQKVQEIRRARDAKEAELTRARAEARLRFFEEARPIVGQMMIDQGAVAVLDSRSVFVTVRAADITEAAIARIDAQMLATESTEPGDE